MGVDDTQPLITHLIELRKRLINSILAILVIFLALVYFANDIYQLVSAPLIRQMPVGATMIAIGTSLPELVTTITAIRKKQSSLSVGNIIGANIMDLTLIMPLCALILGKPLPVERQGMLLDIPACLVVCAGALIPALVQGRFKRWVGFFIGGLYIVYLVIMFTCFGA